MATDYHKHDGMDQPRIDPADLLGFPILSAVPDFKATEGTIVLVFDGADYFLYAMINRDWRGTQLTL